MKVNFGQDKQLPQTGERSGTVPARGGGVIMAPNMIRESETFDRNGNLIDPRTKQIIKRASQENE